MFDSISGAQKSVYLEMYIFNDDMHQFNFFNLLKEKATQGLQVIIILDSFGSHELSKAKIKELKDSGIELLFMSYFFHHAHRKILIVDEHVAFIGGVNFHQSAELWNDLVVRIKGSLVKKITRSFAKSYVRAGGTNHEILSKQEKNGWKKTKTWIVDHFPITHKHQLRLIYTEHINTAKNRIIFITPYFMPKRWMLSLLHQAVLRGVTVEVLVPQYTDHYIIDRVNYFYIYKLSKVGVQFYTEHKMNHAKAMIIDDDEAMIGSQNLDFLSFDYNSEVGIFFKNTKVISTLLKISDGWKSNSTLFDYKTYKPLWFDYLLSPFITILFRILM